MLPSKNKMWVAAAISETLVDKGFVEGCYLQDKEIAYLRGKKEIMLTDFFFVISKLFIPKHFALNKSLFPGMLSASYEITQCI